MTPAEILRNRGGAAQIQMSAQQAADCIAILRNAGYKLTCRDIGEAVEVVQEISGQDAERTVKLVSQNPAVIWAQLWDAQA